MPRNRQTITVLLIEDDPEFADLVQNRLIENEDNSFELSWTDSLAAGLQRLNAGGVDIILLDLGLSGSSGAATLTTLRNSAANGACRKNRATSGRRW